jgi:hypothetical protein
LDNYAKEIVERNSEELVNNIVAERIYAELYKKEQQIRSSSAYCLGKFILAPFKKIKQLFKL